MNLKALLLANLAVLAVSLPSAASAVNPPPGTCSGLNPTTCSYAPGSPNLNYTHTLGKWNFTFSHDGVIPNPGTFNDIFEFIPLPPNVRFLGIADIQSQNNDENTVNTVLSSFTVGNNTIPIDLMQPGNFYHGQGPVKLKGMFDMGVTGQSSGSGQYAGNLSLRAVVPEPATWAMMLLGFGAIGVALRQRRKRIVSIA